MTQPQPRRAAVRDVSRLCVVAALILTSGAAAWASPTGPFGAGLPDDGGFTGASLFPQFVEFLISIQIYFNQHLTAAVRAIHHDSTAIWTLLGLSFAYGIVHAIGPGHGKAVVSSYVLATRQTLRNGVALACIASLAQAAGAIALILVASMLLHLTSVSITWATFQFEVASDAVVLLLGCWLVWTKIIKPARSLKLAFEPVTPFTRPELYLDGMVGGGPSRFQATEVAGVPEPSGHSLRVSVRAAAVANDPCDCGGLHIPDAAMAAGTLDWRKAWTVVASTALRPCTGALIVMVFSISQGLLAAGIASTLMMGIGTALTVATLAVLSVSARKTAFVLTGADSPLGRRIKRGVEVCGALAVLSAGVLLLLGSIFLQ